MEKTGRIVGTFMEKRKKGGEQERSESLKHSVICVSTSVMYVSLCHNEKIYTQMSVILLAQ